MHGAHSLLQGGVILAGAIVTLQMLRNLRQLGFPLHIKIIATITGRAGVSEPQHRIHQHQQVDHRLGFVECQALPLRPQKEMLR